MRESHKTKNLFMRTWWKHSLYVSALASRKGGWSGIRLAFRRELAWGVSRFAMDTTHLEENLLVEPSQARPDVELEHDFQTTSLDTGFETGSVSYTPSIAKTDFAEFLPGQNFDESLELSRNYNTAAVVGSAWTSLQSDIPKLP